ncbi:MAG: biotin/lipoyl-containing protein, partial [Sphingomonadales bacterium]
VTEMVTGIDLVEQMIRVAAGEKLSITQNDVKLKGWAIESRVYAEDPVRGFLPSIGRLTKYRPPADSATVRVDTGIYEGSEISMFYDPMIAKLITYGPSREDAVLSMRHALDAYYIRGITHNIPFLSAIMTHPRFLSGNITTGFIAEEYPDGFAGGALSADGRVTLIAVATLINAVDVERAARISGKMNDSSPDYGRDWVATIEGEDVPVTFSRTGKGYDVLIDGTSCPIETAWTPGQPVVTGMAGGRPVSVEVDRRSEGYLLTYDGVSLPVVVRTPRAAQLARLMPEKVAPDTSRMLLCPMPGLVVSIEVAEGEDVKAGQAAAVVEAMKMENILRVERDGVIAKINVKAGDSLAVDDVIMEFK